MPFDVRCFDEVREVFDRLPAAWKEMGLVNNAGLAVGLESLHEGVISDWNCMIGTNIKGLLYVTRMVVSGMIARWSGYIVNIGSIASREVVPTALVYCATKHAVDVLSKGMRMIFLP
jgi:NADP-dependent 3-hydroxy acid dehydrogenase YdfG